MSLSRLQQRLSRLEKSRKQNTCNCPPEERYDFDLLTAEERLRLVQIVDKAEPEESNPCPSCGRDRAPANYDRLTDTELMVIVELLERCTVENGPHEWEDLWTMTEADG